MLTKSFCTKVVINPLTINSFSQDDRLGALSPAPPGDAFLLLDGDDFELLDGDNFELLE